MSGHSNHYCIANGDGSYSLMYCECCDPAEPLGYCDRCGEIEHYSTLLAMGDMLWCLWCRDTLPENGGPREDSPRDTRRKCYHCHSAIPASWGLGPTDDQLLPPDVRDLTDILRCPVCQYYLDIGPGPLATDDDDGDFGPYRFTESRRLPVPASITVDADGYCLS